MKLVRLAITIALAVYGIVIVRSPEPFAFVDHVNLAVHEAGHVVFAPFGDTMHWLGGTVLQLLVPLVFCGYFVREGDEHGASVALWWTGESLWNVSTYVRDAEAMALPLVGGGEHDWNTLLTSWGMMRSYVAIADGVRVTGALLVVLSVLWGLSSVVRGRGKASVPKGWRPVQGPAAARRH